jgi:hypothetical protein
MAGPVLGGWLASFMPIQNVFLVFIPLLALLGFNIKRVHAMEEAL